MKKSDVKVGRMYTAKVSDRIVTIRIDSVHSKQGWTATNTATGKRVHIKRPQRLRGPARRASSPDKESKEAKQGKEATIPPKTTKATAQPAIPPQADKPKRLSALDAAAEVLKETGKAMNCKVLVAEMAKRDLWTSPQGRTPHATLSSGIMREIRAKGSKARFEKADRGQYRYRNEAAADYV